MQIDYCYGVFAASRIQPASTNSEQKQQQQQQQLVLHLLKEQKLREFWFKCKGISITSTFESRYTNNEIFFPLVLTSNTLEYQFGSNTFLKNKVVCRKHSFK